MIRSNPDEQATIRALLDDLPTLKFALTRSGIWVVRQYPKTLRT